MSIDLIIFQPNTHAPDDYSRHLTTYFFIPLYFVFRRDLRFINQICHAPETLIVRLLLFCYLLHQTQTYSRNCYPPETQLVQVYEVNCMTLQFNHDQIEMTIYERFVSMDQWTGQSFQLPNNIYHATGLLAG